jgi:energy-coupling factor transport system ATP-binding protein
VIAGLLPADVPGELAGTLEVGDGPPVLGRAGILFQDPGSQLVAERADDDVAFGLENRAWSLDAMRRRVPDALAGVGLAGFEARRPNRLSGGEQQRLALAGVEAPVPQVFVLDEPTANLDTDGAAAVYDRVAALATARETTIVLVDHRADRAWPLADLVLALDTDGSAIDLGPPAAVLQRSGKRLAESGIWLPDDLAASSARRGTAPAQGPLGNAATRDPVLSLTEAWYAYAPGHPAVRDVNLEIGAGERVALVGPNGSGKSTLLGLAVGALRPTAGRVELDGQDPRRLRPAELAATVGFVVQDPELGFIAATVAEELDLGLDEAGRAHARELAEALALGIDRFGGRSPYQLSGGEQRRLSLVTALARRPRLLVLDEPTFGQDRRGYEALVAALDELVSAGTAILAATHDERFAAEATDRRVAMYEGWLETPVEATP